MKKILSNNITTNAAQPFKQGTWIHLQEGISESLEALARQIVGSNYDATKVYILYGCVNSTTAPIYTVTAGAVFYAGETYLVPAFSFTAASFAVGAIDVSYFAAANADPVEFTDASTHNVHAIRRILVTDGATGVNLNYDNWVDLGAWKISTDTTGASVSTSTGTFTSLYRKWKAGGGRVTLTFTASLNITVSNAGGIVLTIPLPIPTAVSGINKGHIAVGLYYNAASVACPCAISAGILGSTDIFTSILVPPGTGSGQIFDGEITYEI